MRHAIVGTILLLTASAAWADHRPALTWQGQVNGTAILRIQGDHVDIDNRRGSVSGMDYRFITPLADYGQNIDVENRQGNARVRILEHPQRSNNFTATVQIDSRGRNAEPVALNFYWDDRRNASSSRGNDNGYGTRSRNDDYGYGARNRQNDDYETRSRQDDRFGSNYPQNSSPRNSYPQNSYPQNNGGAGVARWSGQVDGQVQVMFRGDRAWSQRISGQNTSGERFNFSNALPRGAANVSVNKVRGRGDVRIVEQPSPNNNYTLVVEINDKDGGSDMYDIEVNWR